MLSHNKSSPTWDGWKGSLPGSATLSALQRHLNWWCTRVSNGAHGMVSICILIVHITWTIHVFSLSCDSPCFILTSILHIDYVWLCISIYIYTIIYMCIYTNITNTMQFMLLQLYYIRIHVHFICVHGKCLVFARLRNDGGGSLKIIIILLSSSSSSSSSSSYSIQYKSI